MDGRPHSFLLSALWVAFATAPLAAQQGVIAGRVTNATTLDPVALARISIVGADPADAVVSESDGSFELRLPAGVYDLMVEAGDFAPTRFDRVRVHAGLTTTKYLPLESQGYRLAGFIVTASRTLETEITAPSSSDAVSSREILERPVLSPVEHLRESPGVDVGTHGIQATNVVARGFNNIFSGALHMLTDYRLAGLPALRVNFMHLLPPNDADIERIEVVLGPGSALYGPNTAKGVVHVITKSPLESPGTTVSLGMGERSVWQGSFRSAFKVNEEFAVKLSGQAFLGEEWPYADPEELQAQQTAEEARDGCLADRLSRGATQAVAEVACDRIGDRDYDTRRYGMEARADWRYSRRGTLVGTYGITDASGIELTGLGATQIDHWIYQFVQGRFTYDRWAVQAYFNFNDSGEAYQLRDGMPLVDRSRLGVLQVQNGFDVAGGRQDFTYGWDYFATRPRSDSTIYGDYEGENDMEEWGLYLQSRTSLSRHVDLIAAGRIDNHSILPNYVFSPRLALMVKPNPANAIRVAYNRAFETPTALNYFLDMGAGYAPEPLGSLGYTSRGFGSGRDGFAWQNPDRSLRGMRSPFNGNPGELLPVEAAELWQLGLKDSSPLAKGLSPEILALLRTLSPGSDVGIRWGLDDDLRPLSELTLPDVPPIREGSIESFEAGWSGVLRNALRVSLDVYHTTYHDFVSPLTVETPLLFLDVDGLTRWLGDAYVPARVQDLVGAGLSPEAALQRANQEAGMVAAGMGKVPLAVVSSDAVAMENGGADLIATYRNVGDLSLWGGDAALELLLGSRWTLRGTYSHVSRNWFPVEREPVALNAPADKATLGVAYRDEAGGVNASARVRYTGGFPFSSTDYRGTRCLPGDHHDTVEDCIAARALVDVALGYRLPGTQATLQVGVNNLLDTPYRSFVGVPAVRRLALVRIRYDL